MDVLLRAALVVSIVAAVLWPSLAFVLAAMLFGLALVLVHAWVAFFWQAEIQALDDLQVMRIIASRLLTVPGLEMPHLAAAQTAIDTVFPRSRAQGIRALRRKLTESTIPGVGEIADALAQGLVLTLCRARRDIPKVRDELKTMFDMVGEIDLRLAIARLLNEGAYRPAIVGEEQGVVLLGAVHPLLDGGVQNDLRLVRPGGLVLTGSNMAGKSTWLRTIAIEIVVAQSLGISASREHRSFPLRVMSLMRIADDLRSGKSRYRAEADGVQEMLKAAGEEAACLFVLDELFSGTNPLERTAASLAVIEALIERHLVVLATHDLALVEALGDGVQLGNFSEAGEGNDVEFDYRVREGIGVRPNAIAILDRLGYPRDVVARARRHVARQAGGDHESQ